MDKPDFDIDAYLDRVGLDAMVPDTGDGLETLHRAQVYSIPFENFDIQLGRGISLEPGDLFEKMVQHPRGGYCFELNGLFLLALQQAGFSARPLLARVHLRGEPSGRTHQLSLVTINGRDWIADVGFGSDGLRAPVPLEPGTESNQDGYAYRLTTVDPFGIMLQLRQNEIWQDLYSFDMGHVCPQDIILSNHYTATHPGSFFTWARVANLPKRSGRVSLMDFSLTESRHGKLLETTLTPGPAYLDALMQYFGIRLDAGYDSLRPIKT